ncbi:MAG TPA: DUF4837 family protein [bacterium]
MRRFKKFRLSILLIGSVILTGCLGKSESLGDSTDIYVIADSTDWSMLAPTLREVFQKEIITPQPEYVFELIWVSPENLGEHAKKKNLILAGALHAEGGVVTRVGLSSEVKARVAQGTAFVFPKQDQWAKNQLLVVLVSNSLLELEEKLLENKEYLYDIFEKKLMDETIEEMYGKLEQVEIEQQLLQKFGWMVRVQHDYIINIERPQDRLVMLRRSLPGRERWLFVHWIDDGDSARIDEEWAVATRNRLTAKFYENDRINKQYLKTENADFLGRSALKLEGLWENEEKVIGGPFRNYTFYDGASRRIYMLDAAVLYPGGEKEPFLRQVDVMAHTFRTASEIEADVAKK